MGVEKTAHDARSSLHPATLMGTVSLTVAHLDRQVAFFQETLTMGIAEGLPFARRADGRPSDGRDPLDLDALFRELKTGDTIDQPIPPATRIGHVHLYVRNVPEAVKFYTEAVGGREVDRRSFHLWRTGPASERKHRQNAGLSLTSEVVAWAEAHDGGVPTRGDATQEDARCVNAG